MGSLVGSTAPVDEQGNTGERGSFMVDCRGRSRGLAIFWQDSVKVCIKSYSNGHIDCIVHDSKQDWRFTGFYGNPEVPMRHFSWELLHRLKDIAELKEIPWLIGGDFNEICFDSEKLGGNRRAPSQMQAFREILELCELQDLHCLGHFACSYTAISYKTELEELTVICPFGSKKDCYWRRGVGRLHRIPKRLKSKQDHLNNIKTSTQWHDNFSQINILETEIENLATQEEMYWRQRSRISWLKDGDHNTRRVLSRIIEASQSAFIPGHLITDNIIVGFKILHWLRNRKAGRSGYAALKLDMSKAYDRVELDFLQLMMMRLGFDQEWIGKVMNCVKSVSYYFRVNQEVVGPIKPSRGLRQGDPLSPYLFVLCAHGLSSLFNAYEYRGFFRGVKIAPTSPSVSHLFFADDSMVFFKAAMEDGARVKECLSCYEKASGQPINYDKSALSFSPNTHPLLMDTIKNILTIPVVHQHDLYLGLPTVSLKSKRLQFKYLVDRMVKRIQGWGNKWFSTGGKEVLIKSILQVVPTFAMSCFKLPTGVFHDIERECANFWWGVEKGKRRMHWRSWEFLCQVKGRGGLGFRKLTEFNRALLAKQLWRLIRYPDSLVSRVLKGRYFMHGSVLEAGLGSNPSYIWRSILWIRISSCPREVTVSALIQDGEWNANLISNSFNPYVAGEILKIPLSVEGTPDILFWRHDAKGQYTVRDGCRTQRGLFLAPEHQLKHPNEDWWPFLRSLSVPPKIRLFWWSIYHDCIPTNQNLSRHHVSVNESCNLCNFSIDSSGHALFFCAAIKHLWKNTSFAQVLRGNSQADTLELCLWLKDQFSKTEFEEFAIHTWAVWKEKQKYLHGDKEKLSADNVS
ncbi:uncharacterized protein LOC142505947 [Primulina tabacum]|uniref:uncharacterized protein LOC142505947 n=1 Tax=Primulina tabacum TaxID=48773 RepID=UPI003F5916CA